MESQTVPNSIGFLSTDTRLSRSELRELAGLASSLRTISAGRLSEEEQESISTLLREISRTLPCRDRHGLPFALLTLRTAVLFAESVEPDHDILVYSHSEPPCGCRESNPGPLEEPQVL